MAGLFDLIAAEDLCAKLDHDYQRVKADPADVFAAFDFIVTAWHLLEWTHPGKEGKAQRDALRQQYPILALCEHLCVSGKHYEPTDPNLRAAQGSFRRSITMDRFADLVMEFWRGPGGCPKESHVSGSAM